MLGQMLGQMEQTWQMGATSTAVRRRVWAVLGLAVTVVVVIGVGWAVLDDVARSDPARCSVVPAARAEVNRGAWAEPDTCTYYDNEGQRVLRGSEYAGPVVRSSAEVVRDNALRFGLATVAAVGGGGWLLARRLRARPRRARQDG